MTSGVALVDDATPPRNETACAAVSVGCNVASVDGHVSSQFPVAGLVITGCTPESVPHTDRNPVIAPSAEIVRTASGETPHNAVTFASSVLIWSALCSVSGSSTSSKLTNGAPKTVIAGRLGRVFEAVMGKTRSR